MLPGQKMLSPDSYTPLLPRHIHSVPLELLIDTSALRTQGSGGGLWGAQQGGAQKAPSTASVTLSLNISTALSCPEVNAMQILRPAALQGHSSRCCSHPVRKEDGKRGEAESAGVSGSPTLRHLTRATPVQAEGLLSAQQIKHRHFGNRHLRLKSTVSAGKQPLPISLPLRFCFRSHRPQPLPPTADVYTQFSGVQRNFHYAGSWGDARRLAAPPGQPLCYPTAPHSAAGG